MYDAFCDVTRQNLERDFDPNIYDTLQCYVYVLRNPLTGHIFYVGKAGGTLGMGNPRVLSHFQETEDWLNTRFVEPSAKILQIARIWSEDLPVEWFIVRHGLTADNAFDVEASVIDALAISQNGATFNILRGHHAQERGLLTQEAVNAIAAAPVSPRSAFPRVFVFQIHNALMAGAPLQDAVEGDWIVSVANRLLDDHPVAVGLSNGVSCVVLGISAWNNAPPGSSRYRFSGVPTDSEELLNKSFLNIIGPAQAYLGFGGGYVIVEFNGRGEFRFVRGHVDHEAWHPC